MVWIHIRWMSTYAPGTESLATWAWSDHGRKAACGHHRWDVWGMMLLPHPQSSLAAHHGCLYQSCWST
jgi:hypothetical protein